MGGPAPDHIVRQHTESAALGKVPQVAGGGRRAEARALVQAMGLELLEAVQGIQPGVQRQRRAVAAEFVAVQEGCVFFLDVAAVGQQNGAQVASRGGGVDVTAIALAIKQGNIATVVQMRMRQDNRINVCGGHRHGVPVAQA